jgi:hypothetical protein
MANRPTLIELSKSISVLGTWPNNDYPAKWKVIHWKSVNTTAFLGTNSPGEEILLGGRHD